MFEPHYPVYRGKRVLTVKVLRPKTTRFTESYAETRVCGVHCDARYNMEVFTVSRQQHALRELTSANLSGRYQTSNILLDDKYDHNVVDENYYAHSYAPNNSHKQSTV